VTVDLSKENLHQMQFNTKHFIATPA